MATRSWNRVELIGNLTRDPELRYTPAGTAVATFSIATNRTYVSDGEKKEETDFHRIVSWNKLAELCSQLLKKGNRVFVSGRLQNRSWEGQDGQSRQTTEIVIEDMILLTSRNGFVSQDKTPQESTAPVKAPQPVEVEEKPSEQEVKLTAEDESESSKTKKSSKAQADSSQASGKEDPGDLDDLPF